MTQFNFNGVDVTEEEFYRLMDESQQAMIGEEVKIKNEYGVSDDTASAICYLRTRSRWTLAKETELVYRDLSGDPIPLGSVLSGEF